MKKYLQYILQRGEFNFIGYRVVEYNTLAEQQKLNEARLRWEEAKLNIQQYEIIVVDSQSNLLIRCDVDNGLIDYNFLFANGQPAYKRPLGGYELLCIDRMFRTIDIALNSKKYIKVKYDEKYGYPTSIVMDNGPNSTLSGVPSHADENESTTNINGFRILKFKS